MSGANERRLNARNKRLREERGLKRSEVFDRGDVKEPIEVIRTDYYGAVPKQESNNG